MPEKYQQASLTVDRLLSELRGGSEVRPEQNSRRARSARPGSVVNRGVFVERNARGGTVAHTINNTNGCETCPARLSQAALQDIRQALRVIGPSAEAAYCALMGVGSLEEIKMAESRQAALAVTAVRLATRFQPDEIAPSAGR